MAEFDSPPPREIPESRFRRADKNCQRTCKNIGSNCILILGKENFLIMSIIFGIIGLAIISIAVWIKNEKKQDLLFIAGGIFLLVYSISIRNAIFSVLQVIFIISALFEFIKLKRNPK